MTLQNFRFSSPSLSKILVALLAASAVQLAHCNLLHAYSHTAVALSYMSINRSFK